MKAPADLNGPSTKIAPKSRTSVTGHGLYGSAPVAKGTNDMTGATTMQRSRERYSRR